MEWLALIAPFVFSIGALVLYRHKIVWFEVLLPIIVSVILIASMKAIMVSSLTNDTEYLTEYVVQAQHNEKWNERVSCRHPKYCTRTESYSCGTSKSPRTCTRTVTYQCGWQHPYDVDTHPEHWLKITNCGHSYHIKKQEYKQFVSLFSNESFKDMKRRYHTIDGDRYFSNWNNQLSTVRSMSWSQTYENKTQASNTIFKFKELDTTQIKGLYLYPKINKDRKQNSCLGCSSSDNLLLRKYNGLWGKKHQVKVFILILDGSIEIAERQRQYWKNGNKNELVICIAKDNSWVRTFSWCDDKSIEVYTNSIFKDSKGLFKDKLKLLDEQIKTNWKRKHFSDFDYIKVPLKTSQLIILFSVVCLVSLGLVIYGINNEFER